MVKSQLIDINSHIITFVGSSDKVRTMVALDYVEKG